MLLYALSVSSYSHYLSPRLERPAWGSHERRHPRLSKEGFSYQLVIMTSVTTTPGTICKEHNSHNSPPTFFGAALPQSYPNTCRIVGWTPCWRKRSCLRLRNGMRRRM